jgi:hypothetical protein
MSDDLCARLAGELKAHVTALDDARKAKAEASRQGLDAADVRARIDELETKVFEAKRALLIAERNGTELGVAVMGDEVIGVIGVVVAPGSGSDARSKAIDDALAVPLDACARDLGGVLAAPPHRYTRERPGRDSEGRTLLDVRGRLEGDRVIPAVTPQKRR